MLSRIERKLRAEQEPPALRDIAVLRNPVVQALLAEYRMGHLSLEEALSLAVKMLCEQNGKMVDELVKHTLTHPTVIVDAIRERKDP